jgi:hypothetical protein
MHPLRSPAVLAKLGPLDADRVGRLVEEGTHKSLMALAGRYSTLFTLQASGYAT